MRLGQLKHLMAGYDALFYIRKLVYGDHESVKSLKKFLSGFTQEDNYQLSLKETFKLAQLLSTMQSDLPLIRYFKKEFKNPSEFFKLFCFLQAKNLNDDILYQLLKMSPVYYEKIFNQVSDLEKHGKLNNETLHQLFMQLNNKIPKPEVEHFVIEQQYCSGLSWIQYKTTQNNFQPCVKEDADKTPIEGGRGLVFQGSKSINNSTQYLVKKLKGTKEQHVEKEAIRETKYARFLGRESHFFKNENHWYIISEWQTGRALHLIPPSDLIALPLKMRIKSFSYLLKELSYLHSRFRVHGDIKAANCVFNQQLMQLKLIDFGSTRKVKPKHYPIVFSPNSLDKNMKTGSINLNCSKNYSFCDDIYGLGIVLASLFPDIYRVLQDEYYTEVILCKSTSSISIEEQTIYHLVSSMRDKDRKARCTSKRALIYCEALLDNFDNLSEGHLEQILKVTLNKKECSFDDIIHDHSKSLSSL